MGQYGHNIGKPTWAIPASPGDARIEEWDFDFFQKPTLSLLVDTQRIFIEG